jgi:hypothetical protein
MLEDIGKLPLVDELQFAGSSFESEDASMHSPSSNSSSE